MYTLDFERDHGGEARWCGLGARRVEMRLRDTGSARDRAARRLSRLRGELQAARLLSFRAADMLDRGLPASATSAMAKLSGARLVQRVADAAIDLLGLEGLGDALAGGRVQGRAAALYRASVGSTIAGGDGRGAAARDSAAGALMGLPLEGVRVVEVAAIRCRPTCGVAPRRARRRGDQGRASGRRCLPRVVCP